MQARLITFCYRSEDDIKVGDLIGILCEKYEANQVLKDGDIFSLGNLGQKPNNKPDDKPVEDPNIIFDNYLFKIKNEPEDLEMNFVHSGTKHYSTSKTEGDKVEHVSFSADEISAFDTSNATLIGIYNHIQKIYFKKRAESSYCFTIKFFDKDKNNYAMLHYKHPGDFKAFILKYNCNVTEDDVKKEADLGCNANESYYSF